MKTLTPTLHKVPNWETLMAEQAAAMGIPATDVLAVLALYDTWKERGGCDMPVFGLEGMEVERTYNSHGTGRARTVTDWYETEPAETVRMIAEHAMGWLREKLTPAVGRVKPKRYRRTKEAVRKSKARADGRVKPRAKKGPPTTEARIRSTEKALATRRVQLAVLMADRDWYLVPGPVRRCEASIKKTEKTLATFRSRLNTANNGG